MLAKGLGLVFLLVGIILVIIGTIFYNIRYNKRECISTWIWIMIALGLIFLIVGAPLIAGGILKSARKAQQKEIKKGKKLHKRLCADDE